MHHWTPQEIIPTCGDQTLLLALRGDKNSVSYVLIPWYICAISLHVTSVQYSDLCRVFPLMCHCLGIQCEGTPFFCASLNIKNQLLYSSNPGAWVSQGQRLCFQPIDRWWHAAHQESSYWFDEKQTHMMSLLEQSFIVVWLIDLFLLVCVLFSSLHL